jgi:predicted AAA+ superfamily ATPase
MNFVQPLNRTVVVDKESYEFDAIRTYHDLAAHVKKANPKGGGVCHVFIDEIQEIEDWEKGVDTILNYMRWFADAHLTHRVLLYDIMGKRHLEVNEKHFVGDLGLRTGLHILMGYRADDIGGMRVRAAVGGQGQPSETVAYARPRDGGRLRRRASSLSSRLAGCRRL